MKLFAISLLLWLCALVRAQQQASTTKQRLNMTWHEGAAGIPTKKAGDKVPNVMFRTRTRINKDGDFDWKVLTSEDLFKGKRVVLFALPGAFTPTCSAAHLPGYEEKYDEIKAQGIDEVYCLSVNDVSTNYI